MSRLDTAVSDFGRSLDRLEAALAGRRPGETLPPAEGDAQQEIDRLRSEQGALSAELDGLRSENDRLASLAETIAGQLDGAIEDVQAVLKKAQ